MTTSTRRLWDFVLARFSPHIYVTYGVLWSLALEAVASDHWHPSPATAVRAVSVVLSLLFLRMLDELKDLDYDRLHHHDRPLVTDAISIRELRAAMAFLALSVLALNSLLSVISVVLALAALGYGLVLAAVERRSAAVRDRLLLNLAVSYPVQLLISCYLYVSLTTTVDWRTVPVVLVFACVFLHFEFARKTRWDGTAGERLYSLVLGPTLSGTVTLSWAVAAVGLVMSLTTQWSVALLVPPVLAARRFLAGVSEQWPLPAAIAFVLFSYLFLIAYGLR
jgi:4-hydroxybenzoate polyprenyltransferase